jgi:hypothetical protein
MKRLTAPVRAVSALCLLTLAGCGAARFDATDDASAEASMKTMGAGMSDQQKEEFQADCMAVVMPTALNSALGAAFSTEGETPVAARGANVMKPLHGLTVAQIHAQAEEVRKGMSVRR